MAVIQPLEREIYHNVPPEYQSRIALNPTLIVSWWCTLFSLTAILIRVFGRWVRTERLFREDWIMFYSIIPLMLRMAMVHVVLIWGTNNTTTLELTALQIRHHEVGSRMVLAARIFYAAYIWIAKLAVLEFLKRIIGQSWAKSYEVGLRYIYGFLIATFVAVVIGTLSECQPFTHYWQVVPDPGPHCREGLVQLIVMGVCDIVSDVVLIVFPIPLVWQSSMRTSKKLSLIFLFLLSTLLVGITAYRIPSTISRKSSQQYRSLLASLEILAAAFVSNAIVIGSFIRDKGVKKAKFRAASVDDGTSSLNRTNTNQTRQTRHVSVTQHHWGSDEDLVRGVGVALPPLLRSGTYQEQRLAEVAEVAETTAPPEALSVPNDSNNQARDAPFKKKWSFAEASRTRKKPSLDTLSSASSEDIKMHDLKLELDKSRRTDVEQDYTEPDTPSRMGFFDVGGLVDAPPNESPVSRSRQASAQEVSRRLSQSDQQKSSSKAFLSDIGGLLTRPLRIREEDESHSPSTPSPRKGSSPGRSPMRSDKRKISRGSRLSSAQEDGPPLQARPKKPSGPDEMFLSDLGGLLR